MSPMALTTTTRSEPVGAVARDAPGDVADAVGVGERRAAVLLDDESAGMAASLREALPRRRSRPARVAARGRGAPAERAAGRWPVPARPSAGGASPHRPAAIVRSRPPHRIAERDDRRAGAREAGAEGAGARAAADQLGQLRVDRRPGTARGGGRSVAGAQDLEAARPPAPATASATRADVVDRVAKRHLVRAARRAWPTSRAAGRG